MRNDLLLAGAAVMLAAAGALWWPADGEPSAAPAAPAAARAAASAAQASAERRAAAARVCADGCDAPTLSDTTAAPPAAVAAAAADLPPLPADLEAWSLHPEAVPVEGDGQTLARLHNIPDAPDEQDATPADESDPNAAPVEAPAGE